MSSFISLAAIAPERTISEVLSPYGWVVVASVVVTVATTPLARAIALRTRFVDRPDDFLKPHARPIPYLGGVAIYLGWLAGLLTLVLTCSAGWEWAAGLIIAGGVIMLVGLADDLWSIAPWQKVLGQMLAAGVLLAFGIGLHIFSIVPSPFDGPWPEWLLVTLSVPMAVFLVVAASNAANLLDGLDGLCSGVTGIISVCFLVLATHLALYPYGHMHHSVRIVTSLAMFGAVCGFLPYNSNPAKIFMGDAGSMLLGLYAAAMMLMFGEIGAARWVLGALMIFALPVLDTALALLRRFRLHRPFSTGDRSHLYDQLVDRGFSVRKTVFICYGLAAFYGLVGLAIIMVRTRYAMVIYPAVIVITFYLCHRWGFLKPPVETAEERAAQPHEGDTPADGSA